MENGHSSAGARVDSRIFIIAGAVLIVIAVVLTPATLERTFTGSVSGTLGWGPTVFRAMLAVHGFFLLVLGRLRFPSQTSGQTGTLRIRPTEWIFLSVLSLLALGLRLWKLDTCLWLDEVLTMVDFARQPMKQILITFPNQNQHMLYSLLAHLSMNVFGEHAWALRLPSVLFGVASIWALFVLGRRILGIREAVLACVLMTVSYHHIWFSQNARGYMGVLFFALLSTWLWMESLDRRRLGWWIAYAASSFFGLWVHMTMGFVLAGHVIVYLLFLLRAGSLERRAGWQPLAAWWLCGSLTVQGYALALPEFFRTALHEVSMPSEWTNPLWIVTESLRSLQIGYSGVAAVLAGSIMVCSGFWSISRGQPRAALLMVLPGLLGTVAVLSSGHNLWPRFFFFSMGFGLLIVIHGAMILPRMALAAFRSLPRGDRLALRAAYALAGLMIVASALTVPRCYALPKQDYTGARDYIERLRSPGDTVAVVGLAGHVYGKYYAPKWSVVTTPAELEGIRRKHQNLSLVYTLPIELKAFHPEIWQIVERDFEPVKIFYGTLGGGEVYVCRERARVHSLLGKVKVR